jgi:hypothetical protein
VTIPKFCKHHGESNRTAAAALSFEQPAAGGRRSSRYWTAMVINVYAVIHEMQA